MLDMSAHGMMRLNTLYSHGLMSVCLSEVEHVVQPRSGVCLSVCLSVCLAEVEHVVQPRSDVCLSVCLSV